MIPLKKGDRVKVCCGSLLHGMTGTVETPPNVDGHLGMRLDELDAGFDEVLRFHTTELQTIDPTS